jgi:hypothetical protein
VTKCALVASPLVLVQASASLAPPEATALPQQAAAFRGAMIGDLAGQAAIRDFFEGYLEGYRESFGASGIEKHAVEEMRGGGKQSARGESCSHDGPKRIWEDGH